MSTNRLIFMLSAASLFYMGCGNDSSSTGVGEDLSSSSVVGVSSMEGSSSSATASSSFYTYVNWATCVNDGYCGTFEDDRDSQTYKWVKIGTQTWMAENLAYLPSVNARADYSATVAKYYVYDYDSTDVISAKATSKYTTYGVLYNWPAAMAACPTGWHPSSDEEWTTLLTYVGPDANTKLRSVSGWGWYEETDAYGFSALQGGHNDCGSFEYGGGYWWMATTNGSALACFRNLTGSGMATSCKVSNHQNLSNYESQGFSVRCLQD